MNGKRPLEGLVVLEFSQYLAGPSAGLRLADMGARVIKIERPGSGDPCRRLAIKNLWVEDDSLLFNTINRNKESFAADLKKKEDLEWVMKMIRRADVMTHNFRPGVMEKIGLDYKTIKELHPTIIYGEITGYGKEGPWKNKPGQDLLVQSLSGLAYTTGNAGNNPVPFGLAIADMICGTHLAQGILAALFRRQKTNTGALVEVSLLESILDFQFELLTTYYNGGGQPKRSAVSNGHSLLSAPYGIYKTADGFLALAMSPIAKLRQALGCTALGAYEETDAFGKRDEIKSAIAGFLITQTNGHWMEKLMEKDIWAMPVMNWEELVRHPAYKAIQMEQEIVAANGRSLTTTRCPIRFNDELFFSAKRAPLLGEHTASILSEFSMSRA